MPEDAPPSPDGPYDDYLARKRDESQAVFGLMVAVILVWPVVAGYLLWQWFFAS